MQEGNYCQQCGTQMEQKQVGARALPVCPRCGVVTYPTPKLAAAVIVDMDGKLLLQRRAINPGKGLWSFPSGYVDLGEVVEEAAVREVQEETGVRVVLDGLVGLYSAPGHPVVLAVYVGHVKAGVPHANNAEVHEVGLFSPNDLPPLAFPRDVRIIRDWQRHRNQ